MYVIPKAIGVIFMGNTNTLDLILSYIREKINDVRIL